MLARKDIVFLSGLFVVAVIGRVAIVAAVQQRDVILDTRRIAIETAILILALLMGLCVRYLRGVSRWAVPFLLFMMGNGPHEALQIYMPPLASAVKQGDLNQVREMLIKEDNPTIKNYALELAFGGDEPRLDIAQLLIDKGADINAKDFEGETLLIDTVNRGSMKLSDTSNSGQMKAIQFLLDNGVDVNAKNAQGYSALLYAILDGHMDVVRLLISHGATVDAALPAHHTDILEKRIQSEGIETLLLNAREQGRGK